MGFNVISSRLQLEYREAEWIWINYQYLTISWAENSSQGDNNEVKFVDIKDVVDVTRVAELNFKKLEPPPP